VIFGLFKKNIKWDWLLQNACSLVVGDDKQFDNIVETLKSRCEDVYIAHKKDSPEYLFSKYKYRVISISYIISVLVLKYKDIEIDEDKYQDWKQKLQLLIIAGNPNPIFSIDAASVEEIELSKITKLIEGMGGKEEMGSFHDMCAKTVTAHLTTVNEGGGGTLPEIGKPLYALYADCFEPFIDGELNQEQLDTLIMYISGQSRGQTNAAKSLIEA
tara:strand:+ start:108 stop:752 length:645 start_codon:yes stop_codon:yes gene_type:complete